MVVSWHGNVASQANVVRAVNLEMGMTAIGVAGQWLGSGMRVGGVSKLDWGGCWDGDGRGRSPWRRSSTFHKGSSDSGSKSSKVVEGGIPDIEGGRGTWFWSRSISIGRVRSLTISVWSGRGSVMGMAAISKKSIVRCREGA